MRSGLRRGAGAIHNFAYLCVFFEVGQEINLRTAHRGFTPCKNNLSRVEVGVINHQLGTYIIEIIHNV